MRRYQIAVIVGSLRKESYNRRLATAIAKLAPPEFSFNQMQINDLPPYNQDDDENQAASVRQMKAEVQAADGILIVTPEYNRSIPGILKNVLDHGSRPSGQNVWAGKPAGILGASPGNTGTAMASSTSATSSHSWTCPRRVSPRHTSRCGRASSMNQEVSARRADHTCRTGWTTTSHG